MADILPTSIDIGELRARWGGFAWTAENEAQAKVVIGRTLRGGSIAPSFPARHGSAAGGRGDEYPRAGFRYR
jgi:hypothetical protein